MLLVLDNYDSFTYNIVQYLSENTDRVEVYRNDSVTVAEVADKKPQAICISPGPCTPAHAGISVEVVQQLGADIPILGICLGHQVIGAAFGGNIVTAPSLMHGKTSAIQHDGKSIFEGLASPFDATRYHSLIVERDTLPSDLLVTAETEDRLIMGLRHTSHPIYGVQFHPESILTTSGPALLRNFLKIANIATPS